MNLSDYAELEKRAEAHGLGDDPSLAQLLHIIQFKEAVVNGHKRTMRELAAYKRCPCCGTTEHLGEFVRYAQNGAILQFVACASCGARGDVGLMDTM